NGLEVHGSSSLKSLHRIAGVRPLLLAERKQLLCAFTVFGQQQNRSIGMDSQTFRVVWTIRVSQPNSSLNGDCCAERGRFRQNYDLNLFSVPVVVADIADK